MTKICTVVVVCCLAANVRANPPAAPTLPSSSPATTQDAVTDPANPREALKSLARALDHGDRERVLELLWADTDAQRRWAGATADLAEASAVLRRAAVAGFGQQASRPLGVDTAATPEAIDRIERARVVIAGDRATVQPGEEGAAHLTLLRRGDRWRIPVAEFARDSELAEVDRAVDALTAEARLFREMAAEISAGKYATAANARPVLDQRIVKVVMPRLKPATQPTASTQPISRP